LNNYLTLSDSRSIGEAWVAATQSLKKKRHAYNLIYSISAPATLTSVDEAIIKEFDKFVADTELHTANTVANTIFPLDTYLASLGSNVDFHESYLDDVFPKVRKKWGTYFHRLIVRHNDDGSVMKDKLGQPIDPLKSVIEKLKRRADTKRGTTTHYELLVDDQAHEITTYIPEQDRKYQLGGPCLSHISFKLDGNKAIRLTALYRSHWYTARALGNLLGLARLQSYVATTSGLPVGPLTIIASEAFLDTSGGGLKASDTLAMIDRCQAILLGQPSAKKIGALSA